MYILVPSFHTFYLFSLTAYCIVGIHYAIFTSRMPQLLSWHGVPPDVDIPINPYRTVFVSALAIALACAHTSLSLVILLSGVLGRFLFTWLRPGANVVTSLQTWLFFINAL